jgi:hypothetical protein
MLQKLILSILISIFANGSALKIDDKISSFSLPNQFDKIHTVSSDISIIIVTFEKESANLVNDFLSSKNSDFLDLNHAIFINDISCVPSVVVKMFTIPKMRDYKYDILLIYKENSKKFLEEENKITVYLLEKGFVKDVKYISTKYELEKVFK